MYKLALCSSIFYDTEIIQNNKELYYLKKKFTPKPFIQNNSQWIIKKQNFQTELQTCISNFINNYHHNILLGNIYFVWLLDFKLSNHLFQLTSNKEWSDHSSFNIVQSIESSLHSLNHINILHTFSSSTLSTMINNMINNQLFNVLNDDSFPCMVNNIIIS